jgi:hypothetical protein
VKLQRRKQEALAGLLARLGVPVGGRVRKLRAVGNPPGLPVWPVSLVPPVSHVSRQSYNRKRRGSRPNEWRPGFAHSSPSPHHV